MFVAIVVVIAVIVDVFAVVAVGHLFVVRRHRHSSFVVLRRRRRFEIPAELLPLLFSGRVSAV